METTEQVIIYQSKWEAERDQFFFDNPEYILYFVGGAMAVIGLFVFMDNLKSWMGVRRYNKWIRRE